MFSFYFISTKMAYHSNTQPLVNEDTMVEHVSKIVFPYLQEEKKQI